MEERDPNEDMHLAFREKVSVLAKGVVAGAKWRPRDVEAVQITGMRLAGGVEVSLAVDFEKLCGVSNLDADCGKAAKDFQQLLLENNETPERLFGGRRGTVSLSEITCSEWDVTPLGKVLQMCTQLVDTPLASKESPTVPLVAHVLDLSHDGAMSAVIDAIRSASDKEAGEAHHARRKVKEKIKEATRQALDLRDFSRVQRQVQLLDTLDMDSYDLQAELLKERLAAAKRGGRKDAEAHALEEVAFLGLHADIRERFSDALDQDDNAGIGKTEAVMKNVGMNPVQERKDLFRAKLALALSLGDTKFTERSLAMAGPLVSAMLGDVGKVVEEICVWGNRMADPHVGVKMCRVASELENSAMGAILIVESAKYAFTTCNVESVRIMSLFEEGMKLVRDNVLQKLPEVAAAAKTKVDNNAKRMKFMTRASMAVAKLIQGQPRFAGQYSKVLENLEGAIIKAGSIAMRGLGGVARDLLRMRIAFLEAADDKIQFEQGSIDVRASEIPKIQAVAEVIKTLEVKTVIESYTTAVDEAGDKYSQGRADQILHALVEHGGVPRRLVVARGFPGDTKSTIQFVPDLDDTEDEADDEDGKGDCVFEAPPEPPVDIPEPASGSRLGSKERKVRGKLVAEEMARRAEQLTMKKEVHHSGDAQYDLVREVTAALGAIGPGTGEDFSNDYVFITDPMSVAAYKMAFELMHSMKETAFDQKLRVLIPPKPEVDEEEGHVIPPREDPPEDTVQKVHGSANLVVVLTPEVFLWVATCVAVRTAIQLDRRVVFLYQDDPASPGHVDVPSLMEDPRLPRDLRLLFEWVNPVPFRSGTPGQENMAKRVLRRGGHIEPPRLY